MDRYIIKYVSMAKVIGRAQVVDTGVHWKTLSTLLCA